MANIESLNWFGLPIHYTDSYIHWSDKNKEGTAKALREAYDQFNPTQIKALHLLLKAAYDSGVSDEIESNCGPEL